MAQAFFNIAKLGSKVFWVHSGVDCKQFTNQIQGYWNVFTNFFEISLIAWLSFGQSRVSILCESRKPKVFNVMETKPGRLTGLTDVTIKSHKGGGMSGFISFRPAALSRISIPFCFFKVVRYNFARALVSVGRV